jgi:multiple sugar transport system substrate-binding protein
MNRFSRRDTFKVGLGALAGTTALGAVRPVLAQSSIPTADVQPPSLPIESGANLRVLRPAKFVQGDETLFLENTKKFSEQTGVQVIVDSESWEDLRPKTAVAANVGSGPDIVLAWSDDPHKFASKCVDLTDVADYLGKKYGGWYELAQKMGKSKDGNWIAMPIGASGGRVVYRKSWVNEAGFESIPEDLDNYLKLCQGLKKIGHPAGFALGNAVGDANAWCYWTLWAHGGAVVDENDQVILDSKETVEALKYAKALYDTFIPGTLSWLDPSNNKAFLAGEVGLTQNGISVYYAAKNSDDPAVKTLAEDIFHARMPIGPVGRPTERALVVNTMIFQHTKFPNAAKEYLRFMFEAEQYDPWLKAAIGYWGHPLAAYEASEIWSVDPKHEPFKDVIKTSLYDGYKGSIGEASAAVLSDFVVVQAVAAVCAGQATPEDAAKEAHRRCRRYYRT